MIQVSVFNMHPPTRSRNPTMIFSTVMCKAYVHDPLCCPSGIMANFLGSTCPLLFLSHNFVDEYADHVNDHKDHLLSPQPTFLFTPSHNGHVVIRRMSILATISRCKDLDDFNSFMFMEKLQLKKLHNC